MCPLLDRVARNKSRATRRVTQARAAVNRWMCTSKTLNAVIDFEAVIAHKNDPLRLSPNAQASDSLHPERAGH